IKLTPTREKGGVRAVLEIRLREVGHRVPTGFPDRNLVVLLQAVDRDEKIVMPLKDTGPLLPAIAGEKVSGKPGQLYAKVLKDFDGKSPVPFWRAAPEFTDTRLTPGELAKAEWLFPGSVQAIHVSVLHRRFWPEVAEAKGWKDNENLVLAWLELVPNP